MLSAQVLGPFWASLDRAQYAALIGSCDRTK